MDKDTLRSVTAKSFELFPGPACRDCGIAPHTIHAALANTYPDELSSRRTGVREVRARRDILSEGEVPDQVYTILSGWSFHYKQLADGRRQILVFLIPGNTIPLRALYAPGVPLSYSIRTVSDTRLCVFPIENMRELLAACPDTRTALNLSVGRHHDAISRRLVDLGVRSAEARLAQLLLELERRMNQNQLIRDNFFEFPLRQTHLADALGITKTYTNRILRSFRENKWIVLGDGKISILNLQKLSAVADER